MLYIDRATLGHGVDTVCAVHRYGYTWSWCRQCVLYIDRATLGHGVDTVCAVHR